MQQQLGHNRKLPEQIEACVDFFANFSEKIKNATRRSTALEEYRKIALSKLILKAEGKSIAEKEAIAKSQPEYQKAVDDYAEADAEATSLKLDMRCKEMLVEIWRTQSANERIK